MNLLLVSKLLIVCAVCVPCSIEADTNIAGCSLSNTNIAIDAQVSGVISTPLFPDGSRDSSCIWKIQAPANLRLQITIETLELNGADDYLIIRDGANTFSPLIGKYGPCASGSLTLFSSGSSAFLQTVSAVFSANDKLRIAYKPTDPDDIVCSNGEKPANFCGVNNELIGLSGVISSPNFPNNYGAGRNCLWTIVAPQGYRVQFAIHWFGIEEHRYSRPGNCDDSVFVSEYRGNYTNDVEVLCGCKRLFSFVSYMEKMWLKFSSYKKNNWPGFYATYKALAPEECPAGKTDCIQKNAVPIGFNAQGEVCTVSVKASSQVAEQETSSFPPSSVTSFAGEGRPTSSQILGIRTTVHPTFYERNSSRPNTTTPILIKTSHVGVTMKEIQTRGTISSSVTSPTLTLASSFNVSGTSYAKIEDSNSIPPAGQLKPTRDFTSVAPTDVKGTSFTSNETEAIKASPSIAPFRNETIEPQQTESMRPIVSTGVTLVPGGTRVKGPSTAIAYYKTETIRPSASKASYQKRTLVSGETEVKRTRTAAEYKTNAIKISASVRSDRSATFSSTRTSREVPTSSFARSEHVNSQSTLVISSSDIKPSNEASKGTSFGPATTAVEELITQRSPGIGTDSPSKGLEVKCKHYAMEITISRIMRPYLVISSLHLQDPSCKVSFSNDTHAFLSAPLENCGTQQETSKDYFIYLNTMTGDEKSSKSNTDVTRKGRLKFEFQCSFKKLHVLSIASYSPRRKAVRTADDGVGNFTFEMDMFKDPQYDIVVNQYPVTVHPGQPMYLQVNVKSRDLGLLTFLDECWVTPTSNPRDQTRHTLIEQGCSRDASLQYLYKKSSLQKFTFQAFRFRDVLSRRLYVHCEVVTCRRSDSWSVCQRGCTEDRRRRRENKAFIMDKDVFLSLGPVNFQDQSEESHQLAVYVKALTGVLGTLALILVIAIVIIIIKRRKLRENTKKTWILLATREQSVQEGKETDQLQIPQAEI